MVFAKVSRCGSRERTKRMGRQESQYVKHARRLDGFQGKWNVEKSDTHYCALAPMYGWLSAQCKTNVRSIAPVNQLTHTTPSSPVRHEGDGHERKPQGVRRVPFLLSPPVDGTFPCALHAFVQSGPTVVVAPWIAKAGPEIGPSDCTRC